MTTIVIERKKLKIFSDTKISFDCSSSESTKIFKETLKDGDTVLIGICGSIMNGIQLKNYLVNVGYPNPEKRLVPKQFGDKNEYFELAILYKNKTIINYTNRCMPLTINEDYYCMGSGGDLAKTVINYQKKYQKIVDIPAAIISASTVDVNTNSKIEQIQL